MVDVSKLSEWLKLKPKYLFALGLGSGLLIFSPVSFLEKLGLIELATDFRPWIGALFLLSAVLLITNILSKLGTPIQRKFEDMLFVRRKAKHFKELTPAEKHILRRYLEGDTRTLDLNVSDGVTNGLIAAKILYRASTLGDMSGYFAHNIQPWAWRYLKKHPEMVVDQKSHQENGRI